MRRPLTALLLSALALPALAADRQTADDNKPAETLRHAVNSRFLIGTAVMSRQLDNSGMADLIAQQFDFLTGENEFKPQSLQPQPGKFNFAAADKIVDFAQRHDMKVIGHNLCWHSQTPAWMFRDESGKPLPRDEALEEPQGPHRRRREALQGKGDRLGRRQRRAISDAGRRLPP